MVEILYDKPQLCPAFWGPIKLMDLGWDPLQSTLEASGREAYVTFALASFGESKGALFLPAGQEGSSALCLLWSMATGWTLPWPCRQTPSRNGAQVQVGSGCEKMLEGRTWQGELDVPPSTKHIPHLPPEAREPREQTGCWGRCRRPGLQRKAAEHCTL